MMLFFYGTSNTQGVIFVERTENVELTVLCLIHDGDRYLLQNRVKSDWRGYTLPGGHVEPGESIVDAVIREMKEETGLTIIAPKFCGVKQFPGKSGRYIVFLFRADRFSGEVVSSEEGEMRWLHKSELSAVSTVDDLSQLIRVILEDDLTEFQYVVKNGVWEVVIR